MKKKNLFLSLSIVLLSLLGACQKEEYKNDNILMTVGAPVMVSNSASKIAASSLPASSSDDSYKISGRILSSGKIDLSDYGFDVTVGTDVSRFSLGAKKGPGSVSTTINVPAGSVLGEIVLYGYDKYGNYFSSKGNGGSGDFINPLTISIPTYASTGSYDDFTGTILNSNNSNYTVMQIGLQFRDPKAAPDWNSGGIGAYPFTANSNNQNYIPIDGQVPYTGSPFINGTSYACRFFAVVQRNSDGQTQMVYGGETSFVEMVP
ncbi:MAG TPA: hypothetical protein VNB90_02555 [Cytophagaceae bacterium]|jgi:hypothetical protein|nr:hypothetical protein [Cytophagaceae bacterium]